MAKKNLHVISHTHWDREWYLTFQQFRMRLVDLVDNLLDALDNNPDFKYFNFDGQTIVLEDYLEIHPEKETKLAEYIKAGRILVGPWYQLNDEYLVSGESTVRSLLVGHRIAAKYGKPMKLGYLPDQFGNISQMPQIFNGFGIDNAIFGRGLQVRDGEERIDDRCMEFYWESPDGSKVITSLMAFWYNNAMRLPFDTDEAVAFTKEMKAKMEELSAVDPLLFMNGVDHMEAQPNVGEIIGRANKKLKDCKLVHSTLTAYMDEVKKYVNDNNVPLKTIKGELREDRWSSCLAGTLSSRIYLKQSNAKSQTDLENRVEPLNTYAYMLGEKYPGEYIDYVWKLLMHNHPHDSSCGCSIDAVHRNMVDRFEQVEQVDEELIARAQAAIVPHIKVDDEAVVVFNNLGHAVTDKVVAVIDFSLGDSDRMDPKEDKSKDVTRIALKDSKGKDVPVVVLSSEKIGKQILHGHRLPEVMIVRRMKIAFVAENVPSCGYGTFTIVKNPPIQPPCRSLVEDSYTGKTISNGIVSLEYTADGLVLERLGKNGDAEYGAFGVGMFEDVGDVGDEYLHKEALSDRRIIDLKNPNVSIIDHSPVFATMRVEGVLRVPESAVKNNTARSEKLVDLPVVSEYTIWNGVPRVDVKTTIENKATDHRIRVLFPTEIDTDTVFCDGQFDVIERPISGEPLWKEASTFYPQQKWIDLSDGDNGFCVINKGLPEFEVYDDESRTAAVTLLRCVGLISGGAEAPGAQMTPEAQCIGTYTFEYAMYPHAGSWNGDRVWEQANAFNAELMPFKVGGNSRGEDKGYGGEDVAARKIVKKTLPQDYSFLTITGKVILSALKKAEDDDKVVVRLYNPAGRKQSGVKVALAGAKKAVLLNLNEEVAGKVDFKGGVATIDVPAKKIITLGFEIKR
ncbi:MAG: hypothetical protein J6332_04985 [Abditibacteriota bacterium]|nr:hypothetical protein [Abditibacteriota bacterium]